MIIDINLKELSGHDKEGKVCKIFKKSKESIKSTDIICEIESGKGSVSVEANAEGTITDVHISEGDTVKIGDLLMQIEGTKEVKKEFNYFGNLIKPEKKEEECDIAIIGGGPGGYVAAIKAAQLGTKVILIEKEKLGGTCLNWGCIPTKSLVRSAQVYNNIKESDSFGIKIDNYKVEMDQVIQRKNKVVNQLVQGIEFLLQKNKITYINGVGEIADKNKIIVKEKNAETKVSAKNIIIATGSSACKLPIKGIDNTNVITSKEALDMEQLPKSIAIIGGGVIGMEFAFIFNSFGVDVTVVEFLDNILATFDEDVSKEITRAAKKQGIKVFTSAKAEEILEDENRKCIIAFNKKDKTKYVSSEKVLVAVGRTPCFDNSGAENINIQLNDNKKGIKVNKKLQTNIENIYAIGDVTNIIQLAHVASHQGIVAVENIIGENKEIDYDIIPSAVFTMPEVATVGVNEKQVNEKGLEVNVGKFPFSANGKALTLGESEGFVKIITDKKTKKVIGGSIVGPHATDLIAEIALAIQNNLKSSDIIETIHAHPTTAESIHEAALSTEGGAIHSI